MRKSKSGTKEVAQALAIFLFLVAIMLPGKADAKTYDWLNSYGKSLVSYYNFNGNGDDLTGNWLYNYNNGADFTDGISGQALTFPDRTDNFAIEYNPNFRLTQNDFTISAWVNPNSLKEYNAILDQGGLSQVFTGPSFYIKGDGKIRFSFEGAGSVDASPNQVTTTSLAKLGEWQHLAVTRAGNVLKIYVNGQMEGENNNLANVGNYETYLMLVGNYFRLEYEEYPGYTFDGKIDELGFFNKALSSKEITQVMKLSLK